MRKIAFISLLALVINATAQESDSISFKLRKTTVIAGNAVAYSGLMTGLYALWYKNYDLEKFHWFNDNAQWNQMDKVGHAYSCYYEGVAGIEMMKWAGYNQKQYSLIGGAYGFLVQTSVEVLDGFSTGWGASPGDLAANTVGSALAISQSLAWDEQRIWLKYSYSHSPYASERPNVLGSNLAERMLKDYNGQTYWLSANVKSFAPNSKWPDWLNLAVGYGANGMYGGHDNTWQSGGDYFDKSDVARTRQFYFSPDIDLTKIKTKKKWQRTTLVILNAFKFPLPAVEYESTVGTKFHWIKF